MRIAIVNSIRVSGGGEKWVVRQATAWRAAGFDPLILCQPGVWLERAARAAGHAVAPVTMRHDLSPAGLAGLASRLRAFRPHVLLCCNERAFRLAAPASRLAGRPALLYRNGLTGTFKNRTINRLLFRWARGMVVISEPLRQEMASFGWIPPEKLRIIRNGIDPSLYAADASARERVRAELGTPPEAVVAAVLARLTEDKGQIETIEAAAPLLRSGEGGSRFAQPFELWIVGEGSLRPRLEALARERGVAERVRFLGFRTDIPAVLQAVDLVVQASHREGLGNTLLEAMAAGRPVIASDAGGIVDVVVPGETGELVPAPGGHPDLDLLRAALERLVAEPERRALYGANGRRRVERHFRLEDETAAWRRLFREVVAGPAGSLPETVPAHCGAEAPQAACRKGGRP